MLPESFINLSVDVGIRIYKRHSRFVQENQENLWRIYWEIMVSNQTDGYMVVARSISFKSLALRKKNAINSRLSYNNHN